MTITVDYHVGDAADGWQSPISDPEGSLRYLARQAESAISSALRENFPQAEFEVDVSAQVGANDVYIDSDDDDDDVPSLSSVREVVDAAYEEVWERGDWCS